MRNCVKLLKKAKKIALFSHENPDPDTMGSTIALCKMLRQKGKEVCLFCESEIPEDYFFLEEAKEYNTVKLDDSFDLLCAVDVPTEDKLGKHTETFLNFSNTLRIDHHLKGSNFAKVNFVELQSACAVIIFDLAKVNIEVTYVNTDYVVEKVVDEWLGWLFVNHVSNDQAYIELKTQQTKLIMLKAIGKVNPDLLQSEELVKYFDEICKRATIDIIKGVLSVYKQEIK